jgi:methylated-DNA-[protein]-cysteine S-methyltransferase
MTVMTIPPFGAKDEWHLLATPVGEMLLVGDADCLHYLLLPESFDVSDLELDRRGTPAAVEEAVRQVEAYFEHELTDFDLPVAPAGTDFQKRVWFALADIGYGKTESYGSLAARVGNPKASRAVGMANGRNPIPLILPCHRVIGSNGSLTGYGGGLPLKAKLLEHERAGLADGGS